ncbi:hypothetical protein V502_01327 [Pseudogymnoascus sp. VKM F-4520 (FW-2644)]|nr:hypothetical protein V502_01327 [Pseudogymnoascus sp. VKM F-4520 (FW-2644)]
MRFSPRGIVACTGLILFPFATAMSICSDCPKAARWSAPGVGFDLTLDYGVSAVHFLNGTTVPNAVIEGNVAYKKQMRELVQTAAAYNWTEVIPQPVPTWLQYIKGLFWHPASPSPLHSMLATLKTDTEAYLGHAIHFAEVSFPALLAPDSDQIRTVDLALKQLGITRTPRICAQALRAAAKAYGTDSLPHSPQPEWVLGLDYSRSALVIAVDEVDRGAFEYFVWRIRTDLGQDSAWDPPVDPRGHSLVARPHYWEAVEAELRQALEVIGDARIEHLTLVGDRMVGDEQLLKIVRKVLGTETYDDVIRKSTALPERGVIVNPLFAAAMGQAQISDGNRDMSPEGCFYAGNCPGAELLHNWALRGEGVTRSFVFLFSERIRRLQDCILASTDARSNIPKRNSVPEIVRMALLQGAKYAGAPIDQELQILANQDMPALERILQETAVMINDRQMEIHETQELATRRFIGGKAIDEDCYYTTRYVATVRCTMLFNSPHHSQSPSTYPLNQQRPHKPGQRRHKPSSNNRPQAPPLHQPRRRPRRLRRRSSTSRLRPRRRIRRRSAPSPTLHLRRRNRSLDILRGGRKRLNRLRPRRSLVDHAHHAALAVVREAAVVPDRLGVVDGDGEDLHVCCGAVLADALPAHDGLGGDAAGEEGGVGAGLAGLVEGGLRDGVGGGVEVEFDLVADGGGDVPGGEGEGGLADLDGVHGAGGGAGGVGGGLAVAGGGGGGVGGGGAVVGGAVLRSSDGEEGEDGGGGEKHGGCFGGGGGEGWVGD